MVDYDRIQFFFSLHIIKNSIRFEMMSGNRLDFYTFIFEKKTDENDQKT